MRARRGFTLIELLVVVVVLGVLAAIAIPRFTGARSRAQDAVARADLRSAYTAALTARAAGGAWPDATALTATEAAPRTTSGAASVGTVSVANPAGTFRAAAVSASGACFLVTGDTNGTPTWTQTTDNPCTAVPPLTLAYADQSFTGGVADTLSATVTGGLGSGRTFSVTAGTLPAGVTLDATTGALTTTGLSGSSNGTLDTGFGNGLTGANGIVFSMAAAADGKVVIGGGFTAVNGTNRPQIARLNTDGTVDAGFDPGTGASSTVYAIAVQADGKVLIGGNFMFFNGAQVDYLARLNTDGSRDTSFTAATGGAIGHVRSIAVQPDGKVVIGGEFTTVNGTTRNRIARLNTDGTLDTGFNPGTGAAAAVESIALQPDGKVVIGGAFTTVNGTGRNRIARLNADGTHDTAFNPGTGAAALVESVAVQPDGKVVIGGEFTTVNGTTRNYIARLNADGTLDTGFTPGSNANSFLRSVALQPDGKIVIGGWMTARRLNADGSLDAGFSPGTGLTPEVHAVAVQADGKVLVAGQFSAVNGTTRNNIARLGGVTIAGFPTNVTVQVAESGGGTASANLTLTVA
jgi:uncharacterized delta-60 repeat protein/prepilin-type N-terminal cleavage/methylation domain-containing protein